MEVEGFRDCWICIVEFESCWFLFFIQICLHTQISHLFRLEISILGDIYSEVCPCHSSIPWLLGVMVALSGGCFSISVIFSTSLVLMTSSLHQTTCTQFGKHWPPPHWLWHQKMFTRWMKLFYLILSCPTKLVISARTKFMGAKFKRTVSLLLML
jgi:hypothetical protein